LSSKALQVIRAAVASSNIAPAGRFRLILTCSAMRWKQGAFSAYFEKLLNYVEVKMRLMHGLRLALP
jgi:hypothetical protein